MRDIVSGRRQCTAYVVRAEQTKVGWYYEPKNISEPKLKGD